jgi:hypothetical protein
MSRIFWGAVVLAADVDAFEGLLRGLAVPRRRLHGGVLVAIDEPLKGPPITLTDELALRVELALHEGWWAAGRPNPARAA